MVRTLSRGDGVEEGPRELFALGTAVVKVITILEVTFHPWVSTLSRCDYL